MIFIDGRIPKQPVSAVRSCAHREKKWRCPKATPDNNGAMPLLVFGAGMFGNECRYKGHRKTAVSKLWKSLKRREARGEALVLKIDEYLTSQVYAQNFIISLT